jgi:hypothetical protein
LPEHIAIKAGDQETVKCYGAKSLIHAQHFNALLGELFTLLHEILGRIRPARPDVSLYPRYRATSP